MAVPVFKKYCKRCEKSFLTHEQDKDFCNFDCENKFKYYAHFSHLKDRKKASKVVSCANCGDEIFYSGSFAPKFCNDQCIKSYEKKERIKESNKRPTYIRSVKNKNAKSYEELNWIAEKKRVFDDSLSHYRIIKERI